MKLRFVWSPPARAELRRIERETAMRILESLTRYAKTGDGDVKALDGKLAGTAAIELERRTLRVNEFSRKRFRGLQLTLSAKRARSG